MPYEGGSSWVGVYRYHGPPLSVPVSPSALFVSTALLPILFSCLVPTTGLKVQLIVFLSDALSPCPSPRVIPNPTLGQSHYRKSEPDPGAVTLQEIRTPPRTSHVTGIPNPTLDQSHYRNPNPTSEQSHFKNSKPHLGVVTLQELRTPPWTNHVTGSLRLRCIVTCGPTGSPLRSDLHGDVHSSHVHLVPRHTPTRTLSSRHLLTLTPYTLTDAGRLRHSLTHHRTHRHLH